MAFNDLVIILFLKYTKIAPPFEFLLEKTRQFSSLKSLEHQYLKQSETLITQICFLLSLYLSEQLLDFERILGVIFSNL